ncbi:hypothetical protein BTJ39_09005 [Izhakiella australiensis]|uniref:Fimbrial-type adhesion domain-containing protein n=1 Tax=Izhakiella australiensis TaxID=1926881 RepID=A0A1S8YPF7_9GAMM|nr:hypothetical protein BTJ39_09005 [Izhakiella australiensis]
MSVARNIIIINTLLLAVVPAANSDDTFLQNLQLSGNIVVSSCRISVSDKNKIVNLGNIPTHDLARPGSRSIPVAFSFHLTNCPAGSFAMTIKGRNFPGYTNLLSLNGGGNVNNVAIEITSSYLNNQPITLGQPAAVASSDRSGELYFNFHANFFSLSNVIRPGRAEASATFVLDYS